MLAAQLLTAAARFRLASGRKCPAITESHSGHGDRAGRYHRRARGGRRAPPLSPVPARLAALCASLRIGGHEIAAAPGRRPAGTLAEPADLLSPQEPDTAAVRDGFAAVTAALPELDASGSPWSACTTAREPRCCTCWPGGCGAKERRGPHGIGTGLPAVVLASRQRGRWHAAHPLGWHPADPEHSIGLVLVPPLPRSTAWVEVLAGGRSGEVAPDCRPLGVPAVTDSPNGAWFGCLPAVRLTCRAARAGISSAGSRAAPAAQPSRPRGRARARRARRGENPVRRGGAGLGAARRRPVRADHRPARAGRRDRVSWNDVDAAAQASQYAGPAGPGRRRRMSPGMARAFNQQAPQDRERAARG